MFRSLTLAAVLAIAEIGCGHVAKPSPTLSPAEENAAGVPFSASMTKPVLGPLALPAFTVSDPVVQILPGHPYFHATITTTFKEIGGAVESVMSELLRSQAVGQVQFTGAATIVYKGAIPELDRPFVLQIGFPVAAGTKGFGRFEVSELPPMKAVTVVYQGPSSLIDKAYDRLIPSAEQKAYRMTDETREIYEIWNGPNAPDNRIVVGIGIP